MLAPTGECIDDSPPSPEAVKVEALKSQAAALLHESKSGVPGSTVELQRAVTQLWTLTSETIAYPPLNGRPPELQPASLEEESGRATAVSGTISLTVYGQINSYYCGPATAETILRYLGPQQSQTYDSVYGGYPTLTGNTTNDQGVLATTAWLWTDHDGGTGWGPTRIPHTLNDWRNSSYYVGTATPNLGGSLSKSTAWWDIDFDMTYGYPVAENVRYKQSLSYIPLGFNPAGDFVHWDVVKGTWTDSVPYPGAKWVYIGQVYHSPGYSWYPSQPKDWDTHWLAISVHHGILW